MNPGELNKRILIGNTIFTLIHGTQKKSFDESNSIKAWAKVNGVTSEEFYADNTTNLKDILEFTIRYRKEIDNTMIVKYNSKYYEITGTDDYMEQHKFLVLRAKKVTL